jgi:hypothetical protein
MSSLLLSVRIYPLSINTNRFLFFALEYSFFPATCFGSYSAIIRRTSHTAVLRSRMCVLIDTYTIVLMLTELDFNIKCMLVYLIIQLSVLRKVRSLLQNEFSTECDLVLLLQYPLSCPFLKVIQ